jgi:CIC family chloride channel protein
MPTLCLGVVFGGVLADAWLQIWPGAALGSYAVIGGAAILAASMQAPLAAVVLLLELTNHVNGLMVPMLLAVVEATVVSRLLRAHSIYSARLPAAVDAHEPSYGDIDASITADSAGLLPGDVFPR